MKPVAAVFDLDGTLYTGHVLRGLSLHHRTHRVNRLSLLGFMVLHMPLWYLQRAGLVSPWTMREIWTRHMGWTVRGWTPERAAAAFAWIARQYVRPRVRPDVMERLRDHQTAGHRVVIVSGTLAPLLAVIGRELGVGETVGTPLVVRGGLYTGACQLPVCQGPDKAIRLERYLQESGDILWRRSYAYADSFSDIPLLERVGHPVAVYPDAELAAHAQRLGWGLLDGQALGAVPDRGAVDGGEGETD